MFQSKSWHGCTKTTHWRNLLLAIHALGVHVHCAKHLPSEQRQTEMSERPASMHTRAQFYIEQTRRIPRIFSTQGSGEGRDRVFCGFWKAARRQELNLHPEQQDTALIRVPRVLWDGQLEHWAGHVLTTSYLTSLFPLLSQIKGIDLGENTNPFQTNPEIARGEHVLN